MSELEVLTRIEGTLGRITLNRPAAINALTLTMVRLIDTALANWEHDPAVQAVLIEGAGERGFCAGGDIRALWESAREGGTLPAVFLAEEYRLDRRIADYPKPFVAVMDGIVMGGGVGLAGHAAHRIVTARTTVAMPETGIGFIPDVGGTWLLSRAPGQLGTHLALTAGRCNGADAILCRLADHLIPAARLAEIPAALQGLSGGSAIRAALAALSEPPEPGPLAAGRPWIDACYKGNDAELITTRLAARPEPEARKAGAAILRNAPRAVKLTLRALREAPRLGGLAACLVLEYRLAMASTGRSDFIEGVRAQVVDKDRNPKWSPATLAAVGEDMIERDFAPRPGAELVL